MKAVLCINEIIRKDILYERSPFRIEILVKILYAMFYGQWDSGLLSYQGINEKEDLCLLCGPARENDFFWFFLKAISPTFYE